LRIYVITQPWSPVHHPMETRYESVVDEPWSSYQGSNLVTYPFNTPMVSYETRLQMKKYVFYPHIIHSFIHSFILHGLLVGGNRFVLSQFWILSPTLLPILSIGKWVGR
jgi:hypothetical protein